MTPRTCASCANPMTPRTYQGVVVDLCSRCGSVYLDPDEGSATGIDEATLFGHEARPAGASTRTCPCGRSRMTRFAVNIGGTTIEIDRSSCCGGVFLDAAEHGTLVERSIELARRSARHCPDCSTRLVPSLDRGAEIDACPQCRGVFFDLEAIEAQRIDLTALLGAGPEAATEVGVSARTCAIHHQPMIEIEIDAGLDRTLRVERARCCGGVFLDAGEQRGFVAAARLAKTKWADREHAAGSSLIDAEVMAEIEPQQEVLARRVAEDLAKRIRAQHPQGSNDDDWEDGWNDDWW